MKKNFKIIIILISLFCVVNVTYSYFTTSKNIVNTFNTKNYLIKINATGGKFSTNAEVKIDKGKTILPVPTKMGYTFAGYSNNENGEVNYSSTINDINKINNKQIYAKWNIESYSISYDLNGGTINNKKESYNIEDSFSLPIPTKNGYTFAGWTGSNGNIPQIDVTISKGHTGNLSYKANWTSNQFSVDINSIIQNVTYNSGLDSFQFSVWIDELLVADHVTDYYNSTVNCGAKMRVYVYDREGYNVTSFRDNTWIITDNLEITPSWYDNIPPTITDFKVENLGFYNPSKGTKGGWNIHIYIDAYDNGTGMQKFQTWLTPYGNGSGSARKDGQDRILTQVLYLETAEGRTFCAYAIDNAGNEASRCETIKVN